MLAFELGGALAIEQRERELLAARAGTAGGLVEDLQGLVLDRARDATGVGQVAPLAGILERHRRWRLGVVFDRVDDNGRDRERGGNDHGGFAPGGDQERRSGERERRGDQVHGREGVLNGDHEHVVEPLREPLVDRSVVGELGAPSLDGLVERGARAVDVDVVEQRWRQLELLQRLDLGVEDQRRALQDRLLGRALELGGRDRREDRQHDDDADVAGDQAARRLGDVVLGQQLAAERGQREPHPGAGQDLRDDRPGDRRRGQERERRRPAGQQDGAGQRAGASGAGDRGRGERGDGQHAHAERRPQRRDGEPGHELDHEQEEHGGEGGGGERERGQRAHRHVAGPQGRPWRRRVDDTGRLTRPRRLTRPGRLTRPHRLTRRRRSPARPQPSARRGRSRPRLARRLRDITPRPSRRDRPRRHTRDRRREGQWDLHEEDRAPVEGLGQGPADRRAGGRADERRAEPEPAPRSCRARVEHVECRQQPDRPADRLHGAQREQHAERIRKAAAQRTGREQRHPPGARAARLQPRGERQGEREHERVDADDRGHAGDRRVHLHQDRRQGERDDRRVRECQRRRKRDERAS